MPLPGRILLGTVIGIAVFVAGCGDSHHHNTSLTGNQRTTVATAVAQDTFVSLTSGFGSGVELTPALAGPAQVQPTCTTGSNGSQNCTIPSTTLNCLFAGTFTMSGRFTQTMNTTTNINTVNLTDVTMVPNQCTTDNMVLITGNPNLGITGTGIQVDQSSTPSDVRLPFTAREQGRIRFTPGGNNTDTTFPSTGTCDVNLTSTFQQVPGTGAPPIQVQAVLTGSICGRSINTTVAIGTF